MRIIVHCQVGIAADVHMRQGVLIGFDGAEIQIKGVSAVSILVQCSRSHTHLNSLSKHEGFKADLTFVVYGVRFWLKAN